jgi:CBS domain containing-hemolysin-like protein
LVLAAVGTAALGSAVAAADAAMTSLSSHRLAGLAEQMTGWRKTQLDRYIREGNAIHSRWLVARITLLTLTGTLVARSLFTGLPPVGAAIIGALSFYAPLAELATAAARARPARLGPLLLAALRPLELAAVPLAVPLAWLGDVAFRFATPEKALEEESRAVETEVEALVEDAEKAGGMAKEPAEIIRNVLEMKDREVGEVMVPRIKVVGIEVTTPLLEVVKFVAAQGHSRYPVYRGKMDDVVGVLNAKDLFRLADRGSIGEGTIDRILRTSPIFVPESQNVSTVMREMRSHRQHLAVVLDEFGGMAGVVTMEDILEEIVGDIQDEYDGEESLLQDLGDGHFLADASIALDDLSAVIGRELPGGEDFGSLGGFLLHEAGRVPAVGDRVERDGMVFVVRDGDEKRISKVEIVLRGPADKPLEGPA